MNNYCQDIPYKKTSLPLQSFGKVISGMESTSDLIQRRLSELGIKKSDLAKKAKVSRAYIGDLANGTAKTQSGSYRPSPEIVARLVKALEITESEFLRTLGYAPENGKTAKTKIEELAYQYPAIPEQKRDKVDYLIDLLEVEIQKVGAGAENNKADGATGS